METVDSSYRHDSVALGEIKVLHYKRGRKKEIEENIQHCLGVTAAVAAAVFI